MKEELITQTPINENKKELKGKSKEKAFSKIDKKKKEKERSINRKLQSIKGMKELNVRN